MRFTFTVLGAPRPKERARVKFASHVYGARKTKRNESQIGMMALQAFRRSPLVGPVWISLHAFMARPKKPKFPYPCKKPDVDNILKIVMDALNRVIYQDDSQIVGIFDMERRYCTPGTEERVVVTLVDAEERALMTGREFSLAHEVPS